jgi:hypothetical protein
LISKGRAKDAVEVAKQLGKQKRVYIPDDGLKRWSGRDTRVRWTTFFYELLSQNGAPVLGDYVPCPPKRARQSECEVARTTAGAEDLSRSKRAAIHHTLFRALLAAEQVVTECRSCDG